MPALSGETGPNSRVPRAGAVRKRLPQGAAVIVGIFAGAHFVRPNRTNPPTALGLPQCQPRDDVDHI